MIDIVSQRKINIRSHINSYEKANKNRKAGHQWVKSYAVITGDSVLFYITYKGQGKIELPKSKKAKKVGTRLWEYPINEFPKILKAVDIAFNSYGDIDWTCEFVDKSSLKKDISSFNLMKELVKQFDQSDVNPRSIMNVLDSLFMTVITTGFADSNTSKKEVAEDLIEISHAQKEINELIKNFEQNWIGIPDKIPVSYGFITNQIVIFSKRGVPKLPSEEKNYIGDTKHQIWTYPVSYLDQAKFAVDILFDIN